MPTVLIVDDEEPFRRIVRKVIEHSGDGLEVVGEASNGDEALREWSRTRPGVVVLDQRMPDLSGFEVAKRVFAQHPEQHIVLLTAYLDEATEARARALGIRSCHNKTDLDALIETLKRCV